VVSSSSSSIRATALATLLLSAGCADLFGRREARTATPTSADDRLSLTPAQRFALSPVARGTPEVLQGNVLVRSAPDGPNYEVILDVRDRPGTPDGVADRVWVLQNTPPRRGIRPMRLPNANVYSREGEVIVAPSQGSGAIVFQLREIPTPLLDPMPRDWSEHRARFLGSRRIVQRFWGVGLAQSTGSWPLARDGSAPAEAGAFNRVPPSGTMSTLGAGCDSGGPGSASCSVSFGNSSCSTSCQSGYYSCCNAGTPCQCSCIPVAPPGGGSSGGSGSDGGCDPGSYLAYDRGQWVCVAFAN
jgi:hypothetical protein